APRRGTGPFCPAAAAPHTARWPGAPARRPGPAPPQPLPDEAPRIQSEVGGVSRHAVRFPLTRVYEEVAGVLKITRLSHEGRGLTIKLEGEIRGPWLDTVREACATRGSGPRRLDLAAVTYVDAAGGQLLPDLGAGGGRIPACFSLLRPLLHPQPQAEGAPP